MQAGRLASSTNHFISFRLPSSRNLLPVAAEYAAAMFGLALFQLEETMRCHIDERIDLVGDRERFQILWDSFSAMRALALRTITCTSVVNAGR